MSHDVVVYTLKNCPACDKVKRQLNDYNVSYKEIIIGEEVTREAVLSMFPGVKTAPILVNSLNSERMTNEQFTGYLNERMLTE